MRNKVIILSLSLIMVLCSSFSVFGASSVVNFDWAEPAVSSEQGYLCVKTASGSFYCFIWAINPKTGDNATDAPCTSSMNLIIGPSSITFTPITTGGVSASYHITSASLSGNLNVRASGNFDGSGNSYVWDVEPSEVCYYGNVGIVDNNIGTSNKWLRVNWGSDDTLSDVSDMLSEVINELVDIDTRLLNISNYVNGLEDSVDSTNVALRDINDTLSDIKSYIDTVETKLNTINGNIVDVENQLIDANNHLSGVVSILGEMWDLLINVDVNVEYVVDNLEFIKMQLSILMERVGEESTEPLPDDDLTDLEDAEDGVITDESDRLDDLSLSFGKAFDFVWQLISRAWQSNTKVFTVVIMCLTIGVLKLILNR